MGRTAPLYVRAWRTLWLPLLCIGAAFAGLGILLAYGPKAAAQAWRYAVK